MTEEKLVIGGAYQHYRNKKLYTVLHIALHTQTHEKMVIYQAQYTCPDLAQDYGEYPVFARPYDNFTAYVETESGSQPRFQLIEE